MLRAMRRGRRRIDSQDEGSGGMFGNSRLCVEWGSIVTYKLTFKMFGFGFGLNWSAKFETWRTIDSCGLRVNETEKRRVRDRKRVK